MRGDDGPESRAQAVAEAMMRYAACRAALGAITFGMRTRGPT